MADYAVAATLITFAQVRMGFFAWPTSAPEAVTVRGLQAGDVLVPKFAERALYDREGEKERQQAHCRAIGADYDEVVADYRATINDGAGAVPFLLRLDESPSEEPLGGAPWLKAPVEKLPLQYPLSTHDFLMIRALPMQVAAQFKGSVSPGRHLTNVPTALVTAIRRAGGQTDRSEFFRRLSLVQAGDPLIAAQALAEAGRVPKPGDLAFLVSPGGMSGIAETPKEGQLALMGQPIGRTLDELEILFQRAEQRATAADQLSPQPAYDAIAELRSLLAGPERVLPIDDFARFYDRYFQLARKVTVALDLERRALPSGIETTQPEQAAGGEPEVDLDELAALQGLTVESVRSELPPGMVLPDPILAEAVIALRSGKHLLIGGPPGTGKSTLAEALCRAVVRRNYDVTTATADWTTFDTIGGYMPHADSLRFTPGVVLRCLRSGQWLVIDELNRADIDKAFGPLFTLLSGGAKASDGAGRRAVLPYQEDGKPVEVIWSDTRPDTAGTYAMTPGWRMLGTLNLADKASLFQLSFAFLRRFAVIDVPLPPAEQYEQFLRNACSELSAAAIDVTVKSALALAYGPRPIGPAILADLAVFMTRGLAPTASGNPTYSSALDAFLVATRLLVVPQYEGATPREGERLITLLREAWPEGSEERWQPLINAIQAISLK